MAITHIQSLWICLFWVLGELTQIVKEFTEILTREEKSFYSLSKGGKGQMHRVVAGPQWWGLSLLLSSEGKVQERGGGFISFLVHSCIWASCASIGCVFCFVLFFIWESVTSCFQEFSSPWVSERDLIVALDRCYSILNNVRWVYTGHLILSGIIQYILFCDWLLSVSIMFSRFIHVVLCCSKYQYFIQVLIISTLFLFMVE